MSDSLATKIDIICFGISFVRLGIQNRSADLVMSLLVDRVWVIGASEETSHLEFLHISDVENPWCAIHVGEFS
jgi:hypothetical protein